MARLKCPGLLCGSTNIQIMNKDDGYSGCLGCVGFLLFGWVGWLLGLIGKNGKYECHCMDCGKRFKRY